MAALSAFLPGTTASRALTAVRTKHEQLRLNLQHAKSQRAEVFRITQELVGYTDRQLADLGLSRSDIPAVAQGTYRRA